MQFFDPSILQSGQYHDWLVQGLILSLQLTAASFVFALPFGAAVALMRTSGFAPLRGLGASIVEGIRNVPLLAHLLFWYFAFPELLPENAREFLYAHNPEAVCAVIALSLYSGVHMAEDIRSGIRAIPVPYRQVMRLGCNNLALGGERVISSRGSAELNAALRAEGLTVLDPDLSLFAAGGGGPHCLTCPLSREEN